MAKIKVWVCRGNTWGYEVSPRTRKPQDHLGDYLYGFDAGSNETTVCKQYGRILFPGMKIGQVKRFSITATPERESK